MASAKIAISLNKETVERLDRLVVKGVYPSRSRAIQDALDERLARLSRDRLAKECANSPGSRSARSERSRCFDSANESLHCPRNS
jgi:Arc/MetJ-type ribon-helix-helix transcriptional regulator